MKIKKRTTIIVGITLFAIALIISIYYRPYTYENHKYNFHIIGIIGNLLAFPSIIFISCGLSRKMIEIIRFIPSLALGIILINFIDPIFFHEPLDVYKITLVIMSGAIALLILYYVFKIKEL